jgi:hypothetical protein
MHGLNPFSASAVLLASLLFLTAVMSSLLLAGHLISHYGLSHGRPYVFEIWAFLSFIWVVGAIVILPTSGGGETENFRHREPGSMRGLCRIGIKVWLAVIAALTAMSLLHLKAFAWLWTTVVDISPAGTLIPAFIVFSLVWAARVAIHQGVRMLQGSARRGAVSDAARGFLGAGLVAIAAGSVMQWRGADLWTLAAPHAFYGLIIPAIAGFGWTAAWPKVGSRLFSTVIVLLALATAFFTMRYPFSAKAEIRCEPMHQAGTHCVSGYYTQFCREPWTWQVVPVDILFVPTALGQLTVNHIWHPLGSLRC